MDAKRCGEQPRGRSHSLAPTPLAARRSAAARAPAGGCAESDRRGSAPKAAARKKSEPTGGVALS